MDLTKLSLNGLLMLHSGVRNALAIDDNTTTEAKPYDVRKTQDWRQWSDALEQELERRNANFQKVVWE